MKNFLRSGLGWGKYVPSVFEPTPPGPPALTPAQLAQLTGGIQQIQPALPPPPQPTGVFTNPNAVRVVPLKLAPISAPTPVSGPMSTGEKVAIGVGGVVLLAGLYLVLRK